MSSVSPRRTSAPIPISPATIKISHPVQDLKKLREEFKVIDRPLPKPVAPKPLSKWFGIELDKESSR